MRLPRNIEEAAALIILTLLCLSIGFVAVFAYWLSGGFR